MLADLERKVGDKTTLPWGDLERISCSRADTVRARSNDTVRRGDRIVTAVKVELELFNSVERLVDDRSALTYRTDRLAMRESFPNPVDGASSIHKSLRMLRTRGNVDGIEHCRALILKVVVSDKTCATANDLTLRVNHATTGTNQKAVGLGTSKHGANTLDFNLVETVGNENSDAATGDGGFLGSEGGLREISIALRVGLAGRLIRNDAVDLSGDSDGKVEVDLFQEVGLTLVNSLVVTVR